MLRAKGADRRTGLRQYWELFVVLREFERT
jgi:hypothetical protein